MAEATSKTATITQTTVTLTLTREEALAVEDVLSTSEDSGVLNAYLALYDLRCRGGY